MSVVEYLTGITERLVQSGIAEAAEIRGLSDAELEEVRIDQAVSQLPGSYLQFLKLMGRSAGYLLRGTDVFYPKLLGLKQDAKELLASNGIPEASLEECIVFSMHGGYQIHWLSSSMEDSPVLMYSEAQQFPDPRSWPNLRSYLEREIDLTARWAQKWRMEENG